MHQSLRSRFVLAEEQFLSAFVAGSSSLHTFQETWSCLSTDFAEATQSRQVDPDTRSLAHATASRLSLVADSLLSLQLDAEKAFDTLKVDFSSILSQTTHPSSPADNHSLHDTAKVWLECNLHDPYPSTPTKSQLAEECGCSVKEVQDWFAHARRRIGWTALCQEKFNGLRRAISEAASRAYLDGAVDPGLPLDILRAFAAIKANVCALTSQENVLASQSGAFESKGCSKQASDMGLLEVLQEQGSRTSLSNPSPHDNHRPSSAASSSTVSSISLSADEEDTTPPPPIAGCKRRLGASIGIEEGHELGSSPTRPIKRHRYASLTTDTSVIEPSKLIQHVIKGAVTKKLFMSRCSLAATPPPPTLVTSSTHEVTECKSYPENPASALVSASPRKRRHSDTFAGTSPKRPRGPIPASRKQVVSDPFPASFGSGDSDMHLLGEWLQSGFDIPSAADLSNVDCSSCDAELAAFTMQSSEATVPLVPQAFECHMPDTDLASATPEGFDFSAYNSNALVPSGFQFAFDNATSDGSSASSPSSAGSASELSDYGLLDSPSNVDWKQDWSQFLDILDSMGSSPRLSQSYSPDSSSPSRPPSDFTSLSGPDDIAHTLFGVHPSFTSSDLLSDLGEFSSLHMPLEASF